MTMEVNWFLFVTFIQGDPSLHHASTGVWQFPTQEKCENVKAGEFDEAVSKSIQGYTVFQSNCIQLYARSLRRKPIDFTPEAPSSDFFKTGKPTRPVPIPDNCHEPGKPCLPSVG